MSRSKYHATKVTTPEGTFDSKLELYRWIELKVLQEKGLISCLERQKAFELLPKQKLNEPRIQKGGRLQHYEPAVKYIADFYYKQDGVMYVEDVKGYLTQEYKLKRKLMLYRYGIQIKEVKAK